MTTNSTTSSNSFSAGFIEYFKQNGSSIPGNWIAVTPTHSGEFYNEAMGHTWRSMTATVNTVNVYYTQMDFLSAQQALDRPASCLLVEVHRVHEIPGHCT